MPSPTRTKEIAGGPVAGGYRPLAETVEADVMAAFPSDKAGRFFPRIVPVSLMRQIDLELESGRTHSHIAAGACRGLTRGSSEFEATYIAARVDAFSRGIDPTLEIHCSAPPVYVTTLRSVQGIGNNHRTGASPPSSPILHGGHLMEQCGGGVIALLTVQFLSCCHLGAFANRALGGGMLLHIAVWVTFMCSLNFGIWARCHGKPARDFHVPAAFLFLMAILPGWVLHLLMSVPGVA